VLILVVMVADYVENQSSLRVQSLGAPIQPNPPFVGTYSFIVHSGVLDQNGYAYSYVAIDSNSIRQGDSFLGLPALNVAIESGGVRVNNLTMTVSFTGSPNAVPWINFSIVISKPKLDWNFSHLGIGGQRSSTSIDNLGKNAEIFAQTSPVINENSWFEFYYYIGNSSTPAPALTSGPPS